MESTAHRAIAIVGAGAVMPDAPNVATFWENIKNGRYSIIDVPPERWNPALYYDSDPKAPDKTYSKIGGWVREFVWDPLKWHLPIPPRVANAMDESQRWAIAGVREALEDYGYPKRPLDLDRTAVILGNAMGGERHYLTSMRVFFAEHAHDLEESPAFAGLPEAVRREISREVRERMGQRLPEVTEDTMPGELSNCIAGRIANLYNFHGPNYVTDAACASAMAAITAATEGLIQHHYDVVVTGGIDRNMGASTFVKFCKIGALSATGTRPFAEGADGFVMGEGAAIFLLKRLADAERDGDKIYAVLRGIAGASDGKGKGITAPNPVGQKFAVERAWQNAGLSPATATLIEGHGTSTRVGDVVEVQSMVETLSSFHLPAGSVALGSVKSNIGHLKGAAGAAGLLKLSLALRDKMLPPSLHCERPSPDIDFAHSPLYVNTTLKPWPEPACGVRRGGLSAFGFGGTNFHAVLEEYIPHRLNGNGKRTVAVGEMPAAAIEEATMNAKDLSPMSSSSYKAPLRGALVIGGESDAALAERLRAVQKDAQAGRVPEPAAPAESDLRAPERLAIDYANAAELAAKSATALKALAANQAPVWKALRAQGIFRGHGPAPKVAFLYTGQGSQYVNMLRPIRALEPIVAEAFAEADRVMTPLLGKPLSEFIFVDETDAKAVAQADEDLRQTEITQPAVLAIDLAMTRLLAAYGITPDFTMGHSLGEYGALVAAGGLPFDQALEAVSARGRGMTRVAVEDNGRMAAVFAPLEEIERILKTIDGNVVIANVNSEHQGVIGGASKAVEQAMEVFLKAGYEVTPLPVSHAFHTSIVAPASEPLRQILQRLRLEPPRLPIVANVNGEFYPTGAGVVPQMVDILARQVASPVQFVKGLRTLYDAGARVFIEVGPKKALQGFAEDVLGGHGDVVSLFTNHPKIGDIASFNQALCGLYAAGLGRGQAEAIRDVTAKPATSVAPAFSPGEAPKPVRAAFTPTSAIAPTASGNGDRYLELGHMFADVLERGWKMYHGQNGADQPVVITGAALGLPGTDHIFDDANIGRILRGDQFIAAVPSRLRQAMLDKHITRLVKSETGEATFETLTDVADVIKLAGRGGAFDLENEFGVSSDRRLALDRTTCLAIAAGIDALRDAGIPLVMRYKTTSKGTQLPERWALPDALRDDTGVIFASAFPGYDSFAEIMSHYYADRARREQLTLLESVRVQLAEANGHSVLGQELDRRIQELRVALEKEPFVFDRRFLFRVLAMGHSQFAEFIGARGPNTAINAACASTTQGVGLAEDWIRAGRCRRVIVVSADDVTSDNMMEWFGAGFLASGAAATDDVVEDAAIPFDRRRHGMIVGMGAAALVVESAEAARERGIQPICEVLSAVTANSAFHGTRLDVEHIGQVMENLLAQAEARCGIRRQQIAPHTVFVSHETYTPARGGSAAAEINALRRVFGSAADQIVIANTKGYTGHAMATGIEDVLAVKSLETGLVPPLPNFKEVDPELGALNLSRGGKYPVEYALRLGAGFGSQISMTLLRWVATKDGVRPGPNALGYAYRIADTAAWQSWLNRIAQYPTADLEVIHRTLRVRDQGAQARTAEGTQRGRVVTMPAPASRPAAVTKPALVVQAASPAAFAAATAVLEGPPAASTNGYPIDVFDLDVDTEGDVDGETIMQAEALATIREANGTEREEVAPPPQKAQPVAYQAPAAPVTVAKEEAKPVTPAPVETPAQTGDAVKERLLALVVEKTGYPRDMLDLDLDMEADLGVDTVKQAEIFAAIREIYNIPRDENRKLRDYPTLAHVIRFVFEKRPDLAGTPPAIAAAPAAPVAVTVAPSPVSDGAAAPVTAPVVAQAPTEDSIKEKVLEIVAEKTGYPKDMLDLDLDLEADLGIDTVKQAEMFAAIRAAYGIPRDQDLKLRDFPTLAHVIKFAVDRQPGATATPAVTVAAAAAAAPPTTAVEAPAPVAATVVPAPVSAPAPTQESIKEKVLEIVAEKTGYPKDMLDLDLDLEADLGIDTVKQAEMFAAIRATYGIPRDQDLKLRDFPTLAHVIRFAVDRQPGAAATPAVTVAAAAAPLATTADVPSPASGKTTAPPPRPSTIAAPTEDSIKDKVLEIVAEKTGYPKDMLDLDLDLEADLGIDTVKQAEMFAAIRATYGIPRDQDLKLRDFPTLAHVIKFAVDRQPRATATATVTVAAAGAAPPATTAEPAPVAAAVAPSPASGKTTAPAPMPTAIAGPTEDSIKEKVLEIVAEKTGYPKDMLDLDLDLEADLGIDTVKQAEMFAAIRATYGIPRDQDLKLRDFPTLAHVIKFAVDRQPRATATPAVTVAAKEAVAAASPSAAPVGPRPIPASFDAADKIPRRVPVATLRPSLTLCKTTGVTLAAGRRVVIMPDSGGVAEALTVRLQSMGVEVLSIDSTLDADALATRLKNWLAAGPVQGVYWLPALTGEPVLTDMDASTWHEALRVRIKLLFTTMRALYDQVATAGTFLVAATRLGGQHGYDAAGAVAPLGGAVSGFTKAYKRERPDVLVKAVDFETERAPLEVAEILVEEALRDPGAVEIGYKAGQRWTVGVEEQPAADGKPGMTLDKNTVFLVTGAAGSIVSAITADLAAASGGTFYLLDLVPEPDPNNPDLKRYASDRDGLKRELFTRIQARGERATPALVEKELAALERAQAAESAIEAVRAAGGTAHYFSLNLTDHEAVARVIKQVRERSGRIDVLLHAAGLERSHFLPDKEPREFDLVFDVKADGFFNLLHAIGDMPLGATVAFSSVAGRFGNGGQTDYSAVNDLLCKISSSFRTTRPATRGIAIDWTAWGGIGMATRGSIPKMMEVAGIDMLPPEAGIPIIRRELTAGGTRGEIVIGKRLGIMLSEFDATGGLDLQAVQASAEEHWQGPMLGKVAGLGMHSGLTIETTLDPKVQPFLHDHQIDGTPVLPGVMGIEAFAEAVLSMLPGWHVESLEEVNFLAPFKFYRNEPRAVTVETVCHPAGDAVLADCRLIGSRLLHNQTEPQVTTHFTGRVRLARQRLAATSGPAPVVPSGSAIEAADIYSIFFHGPAYQVLERAWCDGNRVVGLMAKGLPANHLPAQQLAVVSPRLIELCLQTAGVWELKTQGRMGLPQQIRQVCLWGTPDRAQGRLYAVVTADPAQKSFDVEVLDEAGTRYVRVSGYRTEALPDKVAAEPLKKLQAVA